MPKLHKPGVPMRSVVSFVKSSSTVLLNPTSRRLSTRTVFHTFYPRLINSGVQLTLAERDLLQNGIKFTLPPVSEHNVRENIVADLAPPLGPQTTRFGD